jgi:transposase-like protein
MKAKPQFVRYRALEMYQRGETIKSISQSLNVSPSTVSNWVKRLGASKQVRRLKNAYRSVTINITEENWRELEKQKVLSVYINEALKFYAKARKKDDGQLSLDFQL